MKRQVVLLALMSLAAAASAAEKQQAYKWTDANGVVHFTDTPPPKETPNVQAVKIVDNATASDATPPSDNTPPASTNAKPLAPDTPENRAKLCEQAKHNLAMLQSSLPVSELGPDGKVKAIDDKERDARIAGVNDRIAQLCGQ